MSAGAACAWLLLRLIRGLMRISAHGPSLMLASSARSMKRFLNRAYDVMSLDQTSKDEASVVGLGCWLSVDQWMCMMDVLNRLTQIGHGRREY